MVSVCHAVVRSPAVRVTRLDECGTPVDSACSYATTSCFSTLTLTKVTQDRQDALGINANGDICVDVPKAPILRWYEVVLTLINVDPEFLNIVSAEPLVLNDAVVPEAIGWDTVVGSNLAANFGFEFWTGTNDDQCEDGDPDYGYGVLPWLYQGQIGDISFENGLVSFTVTAISKPNANWETGPYSVLINQSGPNAGFPGPMLTPIGNAHKRFFWTSLPAPDGLCGCSDLTPAVEVLPLTGPAATPRVMTFPLGEDGLPILPAVIDWDDASPPVVVTSGTTANKTYVAGSYNPTFRPTDYSSVTYVSATVTVS
jgi:hypothetical protein